MPVRQPLIAQYTLTATTADGQRLGTAPLPALDELAACPVWRVEERVIGCRPARTCPRAGHTLARGVCENVVARDLTLDQAVACLRRLLAIAGEATCEV